MSGKKGQRAWNKAEVMDYSMLKRYSITHLLRIMRAKVDSFYYDEKKKFKVALEVVSKDIGKTQVDASTHHHVTVFRNPKSIDEESQSKLPARQVHLQH